MTAYIVTTNPDAIGWRSGLGLLLMSLVSFFIDLLTNYCVWVSSFFFFFFFFEPKKVRVFETIFQFSLKLQYIFDFGFFSGIKLGATLMSSHRSGNTSYNKKWKNSSFYPCWHDVKVLFLKNVWNHFTTCGIINKDIKL